jgi:hypothetical protein
MPSARRTKGPSRAQAETAYKKGGVSGVLKLKGKNLQSTKPASSMEKNRFAKMRAGKKK